MRQLSIRRMWTMYKWAVLHEGLGRYKRDHVQVLVQNAFYIGAQSRFEVLAYMLEQGDVERLHRPCGRQLLCAQGRPASGAQAEL